MKSLIVFISLIASIGSVLLWLDRLPGQSAPATTAPVFQLERSGTHDSEPILPEPPEATAGRPRLAEEARPPTPPAANPQNTDIGGITAHGTTQPTLSNDLWPVGAMRSAGARTETLRVVEAAELFGVVLGENESLLRLRFGNHQPVSNKLRAAARPYENLARELAIEQLLIVTLEYEDGRILGTTTFKLGLSDSARILFVNKPTPNDMSSSDLPQYARLGDAGELPGGAWSLEPFDSQTARLRISSSDEGTGEICLLVRRDGLASIERVALRNGVFFVVAERTSSLDSIR